MTVIKAKIRDKSKDSNNSLRKNNFIPAILYGEGIKNISLKINAKDFEEVYKEAGESSLITLEVDDKKFSVLVHQIARGPIEGEFLHIDFYHPSTKKKVETNIPLIFEGEAPAVKELSGILEKQFYELEVKGLAKDLPREIIVNVDGLKTFEDKILIKDLKIPEGVTILKDAQEIVAHIAQPRDIEKELAEEEKPEEAEEEEKEEGKEGEEGTEEEAEKPKEEPQK
jgi:large subunit ribosomal protein L25